MRKLNGILNDLEDIEKRKKVGMIKNKTHFQALIELFMTFY